MANACQNRNQRPHENKIKPDTSVMPAGPAICTMLFLSCRHLRVRVRLHGGNDGKWTGAGKCRVGERDGAQDGGRRDCRRDCCEQVGRDGYISRQSRRGMLRFMYDAVPLAVVLQCAPTVVSTRFHASECSALHHARTTNKNCKVAAK